MAKLAVYFHNGEFIIGNSVTIRADGAICIWRDGSIIAIADHWEIARIVPIE